MNKNEKIINDDLISGIINCLSSKTTIPSEIVDVFVLRSMQVVQKADRSQISEQYYALSKLITKYMRDCLHNIIEDDTLSFRIGQICACISMINEMIMEKKEEELQISRKAYFKNNIELFSIIDSEEDGITHNELAKRLGKSPSGLTQLITKIKYFDYITYTTIGREKYYFLTDSGKTMLNDLTNDVTNVIPAENLPYKPSSELVECIFHVMQGVTSEFYVKEPQTPWGENNMLQRFPIDKNQTINCKFLYKGTTLQNQPISSKDEGAYIKSKMNSIEIPVESFSFKNMVKGKNGTEKAWNDSLEMQVDYSGVELCINQATKA